MTTLTRHLLDQRLQTLRSDLVRVSSLFDIALREALCALETQDLRLARIIIAGDDHINTLRYQIEADCLAVIATQQPAAQDLRAIMAIFSMAVELERMADHAAGIATLALRLGEEPPLRALADLPRMGEACREMTRGAINAFLTGDIHQAQAIKEADAIVNQLYAQIFQELLTCMLETPYLVSRALPLLFVAHNLERIGDRAAEIASRAQFALGGPNALTGELPQSKHYATQPGWLIKFDPHLEAPLT